jgi:hypothetical protein
MGDEMDARHESASQCAILKVLSLSKYEEHPS